MTYGTQARRTRMAGEESVLAALFVWDRIEKLSEYEVFTDACASDPDLSQGPGAAGRWGSPEWITKRIIEAAVRLRKRGGHRVDERVARRELERFRRFCTAEALTFDVTARILGLRPTRKNWTLPQGLTLVRLSQSDVNAREPVHSTLRSFYEPFEDDILRSGQAELQFKVRSPVPKGEDTPVPSAFWQAEEAAKRKTQRFIDALHLTMPGRFTYDRLQMEGDYREGILAREHRVRPPPPFVRKLATHQEARLEAALTLAFEEAIVDRSLKQAVHRFLISCGRQEVSDTIVDLVIAWESILLTSGGIGIRDELSHRFSLNGAHLLHRLDLETDPLQAFERMKGAYSVRSLLVHGATDAAVKKKLRSLGFDQGYDLSHYLKTQLRECLLFLVTLDRKDRPYIAERGWERGILA